MINPSLCSEFVVRKGPKKWEAKIFSDENEIAKISKGEGLGFRLVRQNDGLEWLLTNKVQGEYRPFSFSVRRSRKKISDPTIMINKEKRYLLSVISFSITMANSICQRTNLGMSISMAQ